MSLNIPLLHDWCIRSDSANIILSNEVTGKNRFYGTLQSALESYVEISIKSMDCKSVQELAQQLQILKGNIAEMLAPLRIYLTTKEKGVAVNGWGLNHACKSEQEGRA